MLCGPLFQGLGRFTDRGLQADEWQYAVDTLGEAGEYAAARGVKLALEPINRPNPHEVRHPKFLSPAKILNLRGVRHPKFLSPAESDV